MNEDGEQKRMKLLFVGLDGLSFETFQEFEMPFLRAISQEGVRAKLISFDNPYMATGPVWASVQTGLPPEGHGVQGVNAGNWHTAAFKSEVKTVWRMLNERGTKCGVVNFPVTYPLRPVDAFVVCGFPAPWEHEGTKNPWQKVELRGALFWPEEIGPYIGTFRSAWMNYVRPEEFPDTHAPYRQALEGDRDAQRYMMSLLYRSLHETARLTFDLMRNYSVDLMAAVFMETDTMGHFGASLPRVHRPLFLREVDDVVGSVFAASGAENIIVMSDHGCWGKKHTKEGVFLAAGPAFSHAPEGAIEVLEVAPTILYLWNVYDARLPKEPAYRFLSSGEVGDKEQHQIRERLRALGYLE